MLTSLALAAALAVGPTTYTVHSGDTLSEIAVSHGTTWQAVAAANPQIHDPNVIYAGQTIDLPGSAQPAAPAQPAPAHSSPSPSSTATATGSLSDVPGVPQSFAACVALRESSNGANQAYNGGVYGIIRASGINVNGQTLAAQKLAFSALYAQYGTAPWTPSDGC